MLAAEFLADFFTQLAADEPLLVKALQQREPFYWCMDDNDPQRLAQDLAYLSIFRALPLTTLQAVHNAFALTQAGHVMCFILLEPTVVMNYM